MWLSFATAKYHSGIIRSQPLCAGRVNMYHNITITSLIIMVSFFVPFTAPVVLVIVAAAPRKRISGHFLPGSPGHSTTFTVGDLFPGVRVAIDGPRLDTFVKDDSHNLFGHHRSITRIKNVLFNQRMQNQNDLQVNVGVIKVRISQIDITVQYTMRFLAKNEWLIRIGSPEKEILSLSTLEYSGSNIPEDGAGVGQEVIKDTLGDIAVHVTGQGAKVLLFVDLETCQLGVGHLICIDWIVNPEQERAN